VVLGMPEVGVIMEVRSPFVFGVPPDSIGSGVAGAMDSAQVA
jgi:hypothetical protein